MVKIRLKRMGARKSLYRLVVADSRYQETEDFLRR